MTSISINNLFNSKTLLNNVSITGWVKTFRQSGKIAFIEINDGSTIKNLQVVVRNDMISDFANLCNKIKIGVALIATGDVKINEKLSSFELSSNEINILKGSDEDYPLQKKQHSFEFLRDISHLRPRTTTIAAIMKVRSNLAFAIHKFFNENGFT
ncbi:hypothetical protein FACS189459_6930 [Bacilli bacterium]|nr:hypothetical protein FACS189459_6930 [Bacilli bacterium]GHU52185.1 hypothetical protein FACS189496_1880 [Bacilli bacterium]